MPSLSLSETWPTFITTHTCQSLSYSMSMKDHYKITENLTWPEKSHFPHTAKHALHSITSWLSANLV